MNTFWLSTGALLRREIIRFVRQRSRVIGSLVTPLVFWFLMGSGMGGSFQFGSGAGSSVGYLQFIFPGTLVMIVLFTAIFSTISIIEDRAAGFLQGVLVSPAPRSAVVLAKVLGGALLALGNGALCLLAAPFLGIDMSFGALLAAGGVLFVLALGLTGLGFLMAWRLESTQGFHLLMNLFLMPLWFLSGALFPLSGAPRWLAAVMKLNPLTYGVSALHQLFFPVAGGPSLFMCGAVTGLFAALTYGACVYLIYERH